MFHRFLVAALLLVVGLSAQAQLAPNTTAPSVVRAPLEYPASAIQADAQGTVWVSVRVDATGKPGSVKVNRSSGYPDLDAAALQSVARWHFKPAMEDGRPIALRVVVPIRFQLQAKEAGATKTERFARSDKEDRFERAATSGRKGTADRADRFGRADKADREREISTAAKVSTPSEAGSFATHALVRALGGLIWLIGFIWSVVLAKQKSMPWLFGMIAGWFVVYPIFVVTHWPATKQNLAVVSIGVMVFFWGRHLASLA